MEGPRQPWSRSDVQAAFCEGRDDVGFCTPVSWSPLSGAPPRNPGADLEELKYELKGNICRCGNLSPRLRGGARRRRATAGVRRNESAQEERRGARLGQARDLDVPNRDIPVVDGPDKATGAV